MCTLVPLIDAAAPACARQSFGFLPAHCVITPSRVCLSQVDSKLSEELLRQEVAEATGSCLEAARVEAAQCRAAAAAEACGIRADLEARIAQAAAAAEAGGRAAAEKMSTVEAKVRICPLLRPRLTTRCVPTLPGQLKALPLTPPAAALRGVTEFNA
jgi:hypothetical protein